ncbi:hypothetical protein EVAR_31795_1 [Eumeta japonica]|uniref:Uncharacterized protein n=1 Tax=Eumeta variegata TaxID=151549 RepID=A0A4C1W3I7_EUMVA|nr:hypothetical protein EVAR_31795_1 [Eumeta japonica]
MSLNKYWDEFSIKSHFLFASGRRARPNNTQFALNRRERGRGAERRTVHGPFGAKRILGRIIAFKWNFIRRRVFNVAMRAARGARGGRGAHVWLHLHGARRYRRNRPMRRDQIAHAPFVAASMDHLADVGEPSGRV